MPRIKNKNIFKMCKDIAVLTFYSIWLFIQNMGRSVYNSGSGFRRSVFSLNLTIIYRSFWGQVKVLLISWKISYVGFVRSHWNHLKAINCSSRKLKKIDRYDWNDRFCVLNFQGQESFRFHIYWEFRVTNIAISLQSREFWVPIVL